MRIVLIWLLFPLTLGAQEPAPENQGGRERFNLEDWIPEPQPFSWGVYSGADAVWWGVDYAEESVWNETLDSVNRDPFFLFKATVDLDNIFGYLDWNFSYITDSPQGILNYTEGSATTGPGNGNTGFRSRMGIPLSFLIKPLFKLADEPYDNFWFKGLEFFGNPFTGTSAGSLPLVPAAPTSWRMGRLSLAAVPKPLLQNTKKINGGYPTPFWDTAMSS
jgi:hypothetical protein